MAMWSLLALCAPLTAAAGRPLAAEDAGVLEPGQCELEWSQARQRGADSPSTREHGLAAGCGWAAGFQASLALARSHEATSPPLRGQAVDIGLKLGAWPLPGRGVWALALATGWAREPGLAWRHTHSGITLAGSPELSAGWTAHLNLGHHHDVQARQGSTTWALALEHEGLGAVAPMAEVVGDDRSAPAWNLGLRWTVLPARLWLDAAYGRQIRPERPVAWSVGAKLAF
jgi:hypothetical protein